MRELSCIRPYLDSKTASTTTAAVVHSKLNCSNSLYYILPNSQMIHLQQIYNCLVDNVAISS